MYIVNKYQYQYYIVLFDLQKCSCYNPETFDANDSFAVAFKKAWKVGNTLTRLKPFGLS